MNTVLLFAWDSVLWYENLDVQLSRKQCILDTAILIIIGPRIY